MYRGIFDSARRPRIHTRQLSRGLELTEIGIGTSPFGNLFREVSDEDTKLAIDEAWARGVRYFDTAPHYGIGLAERRLGAALRERPRGEYVISTKVGRLLVPSPETAGQQDEHGFVTPATHRRTWDFSRDGILRSIEGSLERLGLDSVDIVYLHDPDDHWDEASTTGVDTLIELREQGVIRAIGAGMNQAAMLTEFVRQCDVDVIMLAGRYTLLDQSAVDDLLPLAAERGVAIVNVGVYNSGLLGSAVPNKDSHFNYGAVPAEIHARAVAIAEVCQRHGITLPDAAVQFSFRQPAVVSVVLGTRTALQVDEGIDRATVEIPEAFWDELKASGLVRMP
ncbi:MAG: aldo/keto reductase [Rhodoglobus sp.]